MLTKKSLYTPKQQENLNVGEKRLRAVTHKIRLDIMAYIDSEGETNVKPIYRKYGLEQSIVSGHLKILRDTGIATEILIGKKHLYSLNMELVETISTAVTNYAAYVKENPDALKI